MSTIQLFRRLSVTASRCALEATKQAHKRLPKGFNRPTAMAVFMQQELKNKVGTGKAAPNTAFVEAKNKWTSMSAEQKKHYETEAVQRGEKRREEFNSLPEAKKEEMLKEAQETREKHAKNAKLREKRREREAKGLPKLPPNAYALYMKEHLAGKPSPVEHMAESAKKWKTMSAAQKEKYEKEAEHLKKEYEEAKAKLEKK
ncbi:hypothetical protein L596_014330 [Steinernema carpocapsae]|uniref:HMG box domain-containing protein n=1 Tax=Steinernema carpocapsae TaxID=34508 RepID=A0A4U5NC63_STECR|nr:hypothetical protein L596_014330 [Steinernema carpocapsae]